MAMGLPTQVRAARGGHVAARQTAAAAVADRERAHHLRHWAAQQASSHCGWRC